MKPHSASEKTYYLREQPLPGHTEPIEIDFYDIRPNIALCFLRDIAFYLINPTYRLIYDFSTNTNVELPLNDGESPLIPIDFERAICYVGLGCYLLGYHHSQARSEDKALFPKITRRTCEAQGANILATFDYRKRYYLLLDTEKRPNGETNDMMFDGIIVNPKKYLQIHESIRSDVRA